MIEYVLVRFQEELQSRFTELQRQTVGLEDLCHDRILLRTKAQRLVDAIAAAGHSSSLLSNLAAVESRIEDIDRRIDSFKPIDVAATVNDLRDFVSRNVINLRGLLRQDVESPKLPSRVTSGNSSSNRNRRQRDRFTRSPAE